ncbi:MAG: carbohydrate ABC transporter permease, partial [Oceanospirillaceae bacterium]
MNNKTKRSIYCWLALSPLICIILFPFAVMFFTSLKPREEVFRFPPTWLPSEYVWQNYIDMWHATKFGDALLNSLYVSISATLITLLVAIPAAYALARYQFGAKNSYRLFLLVTQMLSPIVLVVGLFRLVVWLGLIDSVNSLVLIYAGFNIAFAIWMLQNYFQTIPKDLEESSWMEGASFLQGLVKVFLPMAVPAIAVTAMFTFINGWNEFVLALTVLRTEENYTLPIQVYSLVGGR